jgi:hypothetical protein
VYRPIREMGHRSSIPRERARRPIFDRVACSGGGPSPRNGTPNLYAEEKGLTSHLSPLQEEGLSPPALAHRDVDHSLFGKGLRQAVLGITQRSLEVLDGPGG